MLRLEGVYTALLTPFDSNGQLDEESLRLRIAEQRAAGISGLVVGATTGEGPALEPSEWKRLVEICIAERGSMKIVANTGSNNTSHSIARTLLAHDMGADAVMVITPYYNKPTQAGMVRHFSAVANSCSIPILLYNVPSRTGCELLPATCQELLSITNIVSLKQAVGNLDRFTEIRALTGKHWTILSGEDSLFLPMLALGAEGIVSATANVIPDQMVALQHAVQGGDWEAARRLHYAVYPLINELFAETSPSPAKAAMKLRNRDCGDVRLPLAPLSANRLPLLKSALDKALEVS